MLSTDQQINAIAGRLKQASSVLFITGAGISAESGLPTYRGVGGLYHEALTEDGIPIETALAGETLARRPEVTWKYLAQLESRGRAATFNRAHAIIAEMELAFERVWVLTQNIDGFHHAAGSRNVIEIHGNIHRIFCAYCGYKKTVRDFSEIVIPPTCPKCQEGMRPDVVFFGEMLPLEAVNTIIEECDRGFDLVFSIGTTSVFPYIRQPVEEAKRRNKVTVEINPDRTGVTDRVEYKLAAGAVEALEQIWAAYHGLAAGVDAGRDDPGRV